MMYIKHTCNVHSKGIDNKGFPVSAVFLANPPSGGAGAMRYAHRA